jgi:hypothetical protein
MRRTIAPLPGRASAPAQPADFRAERRSTWRACRSCCGSGPPHQHGHRGPRERGSVAVRFWRGYKDGWHGQHRHIGLRRDKWSVALLAIRRNRDETRRKTHRLGHAAGFPYRGCARRDGRWVRASRGHQGHIGGRADCCRRQSRLCQALKSSAGLAKLAVPRRSRYKGSQNL